MRYILIALSALIFCSCCEEEFPVETYYYEEPVAEDPPLDGEATLLINQVVYFDYYSSSATFAQVWSSPTDATPIIIMWIDKPGGGYQANLKLKQTVRVHEYYEYGRHYQLYIEVERIGEGNSWIRLKYWEIITDY